MYISLLVFLLKAIMSTSDSIGSLHTTSSKVTFVTLALKTLTTTLQKQIFYVVSDNYKLNFTKSRQTNQTKYGEKSFSELHHKFQKDIEHYDNESCFYKASVQIMIYVVLCAI